MHPESFHTRHIWHTLLLLELAQLVPELLLQGGRQRQELVNKAEQGQNFLPVIAAFVEAPHESQLSLLTLSPVPNLPCLEVGHHHHSKGVEVLFQRCPVSPDGVDLHHREAKRQLTAP